MIEYENLGKLNGPFFKAYKRSFKEVLNSGWYILGDRVTLFEQEFANYCGSKFCSGVANGLEALILSLQTFQFEKGDEVIVPSNTYIATILWSFTSTAKFAIWTLSWLWPPNTD